ncbi:hypothetical protein LuPra_06109 [Luteitalea pratensis]|uniref:DUF2071 domain-containing protein n=1 Tax=Luteitalea pratensis TaxID=1855912 RepID=A0A143PVQ1_LUTPR|nr:DUF2071 domain-containing protein [Luteitalea pratensis]AMY12827.1 hypothetical protein LuPra_06109 [Luteitalea pratensis]
MPFLTARWEHLVLLNYVCPAALLEPLVPAGTTLDTWEGEALVSLVGFLFSDTRLLGLPVPFHRTFEEVNLRFYVRGPAPDFRRAVVFIRELVPRWAIAAVARGIYNEPYLSVPMRHRWSLTKDGGKISYRWTHAAADFEIGARVSGAPAPLQEDSESEFITEHYWGYTRQRDGRTLEYQVEHPRWRVWTASECWFRGPAASLYGPAFGAVLSVEPRSAFVAVGSPVVVHHGRRLVTS